jgi:hypothetical protein
MDWPTALSVLAHELRAPAQVISGYTRMLAEGRLDESERLRALTQIESAAGRIGLISRQASELAHWQSRPAGIPRGVPLGDLVASASARSASPDRISARLLGDDGAVRVRALDDGALSAALATIIEAVSRDVTDEAILIVRRTSRSPDACDILIGASALLQSSGQTAEADGVPAIERGGFGLALVLAAAVLEAHGATLWNVRGRTGIVGVTLRREPSPTAP